MSFPLPLIAMPARCSARLGASVPISSSLDRAHLSWRSSFSLTPLYVCGSLFTWRLRTRGIAFPHGGTTIVNARKPSFAPPGGSFLLPLWLIFTDAWNAVELVLTWPVFCLFEFSCSSSPTLSTRWLLLIFLSRRERHVCRFLGEYVPCLNFFQTFLPSVFSS